MKGTERIALIAAKRGGVIIERHTGQARERVGGRLLSLSAVERLIKWRYLTRSDAITLNIQYDITDAGQAALETSK